MQAARTLHPADALAAALRATDAPTPPKPCTMLRNGRPYLALHGTTRAEAEALAQRTADAAARMGRPARFTIA